MRAIIKCNYANRPKPISGIQQGITIMNTLTHRLMATAMHALIANSIHTMQTDMIKIQQMHQQYKFQRIKRLFNVWRDQSQKPQPYQNLRPTTPPTLFTEQKSARLSLRTKTTASPAKYNKPQQYKYSTPSKNISQSASKLITIKTNSEKQIQTTRIIQKTNSSIINSNVQTMKRAFNKLKKYVENQQIIQFKASHFRNFYLLRQCFNVYDRLVQNQHYSMLITQQQRNTQLIRISLSKLYAYTQSKCKRRKVLKQLQQLRTRRIILKAYKCLKQNTIPKPIIQTVLPQKDETKRLTLTPLSFQKKYNKYTKFKS